jgi:hypothetical protein
MTTTSKTKTYTATADRSGDWWAITVEGVPFAHTQTRRLDQVDAMVRDLLIDLEIEDEADRNAFTVVIEPADAEVHDLVAKVHDARQAAQEAAIAAAAATSYVIVEMREEGYSVRDVGVLLGMSYQRVAQITAATRKDPEFVFVKDLHELAG